jgi:hypothetical protein
VLLSKLKGAGGAECRSIYRQWLWSFLGPSGVQGGTGGATPTKIYRSTHHQCIIWLLNMWQDSVYIFECGSFYYSSPEFISFAAF